jgi:hypothetical protein
MRPILTLALSLLAAAAQAAVFTAPTVDLDERVASQPTSLAIWSTSKGTYTANDELEITFPAGFNLGSINPASCQCLFMKFTSSTGGAFTPNEVTVTAGHRTGQTIEVHVPGTMYPGPWYLRIDPSAGIINPSQAGSTSLVLTDPALNKLASRSFRILSSLAESDPPQGVISGVITDYTGKPVSGAVVVATTGTMPYIPDIAFGPGLTYTAAMAAGEELLVGVTGQNGSYSLTAPYVGAGTYYNVQANYTLRTGSSLLTYQTGSASVQVSAASLTVTQNLAHQGQLLSTPTN